jgi:hypothetical protein
VRASDRRLELYPGSLQPQHVLGLSAVAQGNDAEAIAALEAACAVSRDAVSVGYLAHAYGRFGRRAQAEPLIAELLSSRSAGHVAPKAMIVAYAGLGERDAAFEWLERAFNEHDGIVYWKSTPAVANSGRLAHARRGRAGNKKEPRRGGTPPNTLAGPSLLAALSGVGRQGLVGPATRGLEVVAERLRRAERLADRATWGGKRCTCTRRCCLAVVTYARRLAGGLVGVTLGLPARPRQVAAARFRVARTDGLGVNVAGPTEPETDHQTCHSYVSSGHRFYLLDVRP